MCQIDGNLTQSNVFNVFLYDKCEEIGYFSRNSVIIISVNKQTTFTTQKWSVEADRELKYTPMKAEGLAVIRF